MSTDNDEIIMREVKKKNNGSVGDLVGEHIKKYMGISILFLAEAQWALALFHPAY